MGSKAKTKNIHFGFKGKILALVLPITIIMIIVLIIIANMISRTNIMESSEQLLTTSAKDQGHQIESWLNRKLDIVKTVKYDIENSEALSDDTLLQNKLDGYLNLDSSFNGGFYISDLDGKIMTAEKSELKISSALGEEWFEEGLTRKNPGITKVYTDDAGNQVISACGMLDDLSNLRILSANLSLDSINIIVNSSVSMPNAESLLVDKTDGTILVDRDSALVSTSINASSDKFLNAVSKKLDENDYGLSTMADKVTVIREISGTNWVLVSYIDSSHITKGVDELSTTLAIVAIISLVIIAVIVSFSVHLAVKPLSVLNDKISVMSGGDFTVEINPKGRDEIGQIQRNMKGFVHNMRDMISQINDITEDIKNQADNTVWFLLICRILPNRRLNQSVH